MRFPKAHLSLFIVLLFTLLLNSQVKNIGLPNIRNYQKEEYKGGTQNWDIDQDNNGNLYFANNNGLLQFDGASWRNYPISNTSAVRSLKIDQKTGRIFVGGYNEFGYFKSNPDGELFYFSLTNLIDQITNIDLIWKIHLYNDEVIFQSFENAYIFKDNHIKLLEAPNLFQFSFIVHNTLYFQDTSLGLLTYRNGELYPLKGTTVLNEVEIWGMFSMSDNKLLIATLEKGLFIYENEKLTPWNTEANDFIKKNSSLGGIILEKEFILLNSVLNGIIICDLQGNIVQHINYNKGLQNNTVLSAFMDHQKNLWLGLDNGITFINKNSPFSYFGYSYQLSTVYASVPHKGYIYAATNQGVFYKKLNGSFKDDHFKLVEGTTSQTWNIQVIDNELICANNNGALIIEDRKTKKILDNQGYFGFKKIPNHPDFIIGSNYTGFAIFEKTQNGLEFKNQIEGCDFSNNSFELDNSYLWLKKNEFIYQMELSDDLTNFTSIKTISQFTPSISGIGSLQKIDGVICFQSNNQFFKYSNDQDIFFEYKKLSSLFQDIPVIHTLTEDSQGNLWYVYDESIGVFMNDGKDNFKNVSAEFLNLTGNFVQGHLSVNTIDSNNIFIGLTDGLAHYDSKFITDFLDKPIVFIRSFTFQEKTIIQGNPQLKKHHHKISYASNNVKFTFSSPSFENAKKLVYSYKLAPFNNYWSDWSTVAMKEYTNLKEGDYKMMVKVKNSYGITSKEDTLTFSISPPWYRHALAYISYFILFGILISLISSRIKSKIRKNKYYATLEQRKLYLEKASIARQDQYQMEKQIEKLKRENLQTKILSKDKELVSNSLQVVKKNKILNRIIQKLKEFDIDNMDDNMKYKFNKLNKSIIKEVNTDKSWKDLEKHIKNVHFDFLVRLKEKHPTISPRELDLSTFLLINMSTKEIAQIMNISNGGIELARYRLRKKLGLDRKENLTGFLMKI